MRITGILLLLAAMVFAAGCMTGTTMEESGNQSYRTPALMDGTTMNPIISHIYTADPTARVFEGRIYLYASHDLDHQTDYNMVDYHIFSSDDLVNWQDHGIGLHANDISWAGRLYAPDCVYDDATDMYYLFFPNGGSNIGVAVSENPAGPFKDAIGSPLVTRSFPNASVPWLFDPGVLIDDDGQAYLYFGGGMPGTGDNARVARLNDDLVSLKDESATTIVAPDFFEAAFTFKRDDKYYFTYSTNWENGHGIRIDYMMSDDPMTGFEYEGVVIGNPPYNQGNNNHHSIVEYEGQYYVFYHNRKLAQERGISGGYQRSVAFDYLEFDSEGKIIQASLTNGVVPQLKNVDGLSKIEAELIAVQDGVKVESIYTDKEKTGAALTDLDHGDWTGVSKVDFGAGASVFTARVSPGAAAGYIEVWIDGGAENGGTLLGSCDVNSSKEKGQWIEVSAEIDPVEGLHDLYFIFKGKSGNSGLFKVDSYLFK